MVKFTASEIESLQKNPVALRALVDYHADREADVASTGVTSDFVKYQRDRSAVLLKEAKKMEKDL